MRRVERPAEVVLAERDDPLAEIPDVDDLRRPSGGAGARTSPPPATRCGQYVKRPVGSCGPTISPGRTIEARSPKTSATASSQSALSAP